MTLPETFVTEAMLGVPQWFKSDGCTSSPDYSWTTPACRVHDLLYWRGGPVNDKKEWKRLKREADDILYGIILHNAKYEWDGSPTSWWVRTKRRVAGLGYYMAVRNTFTAKRSFRKREGGQIPYQEMYQKAVSEGKAWI